MTTKTRRARERAQLREAILTAALELASEEGWGAVSVRRIGDRIEYSAAIVYEYFDDKEALLLALMLDGFTRLLETMRAISVNDPAARLQQMALAYWDFAHESPARYQVMHGLGGVQIGNWDKANKPPVLAAVVGEVMAALERWAEAKGVRLDVEAAFHVMWAALHGLVALDMASRIAGPPTYGRILVAETVRVMLTGWSV
jgi:AcrR family transcriptional regulator